VIAPRPPVRLTTRALTVGSLCAAALLGLSLVLKFGGAVAVAGVVGNVGVIVLLLTPVAGLIATWLELRGLRPAHAWLAVAVLLVLGLATLIALLARP
jgi:hypothetical protein